MTWKLRLSEEQMNSLRAFENCDSQHPTDPRVETLVTELIGRVADKWTMLILEVLIERGELRFTRLSEMVPGISYKMLTQTLRSMERQGLVARTVHPVIPPKVEYKLTELGLTLGAAFCGVWMLAEQHLEKVERARAVFDQKSAPLQAEATLRDAHLASMKMPDVKKPTDRCLQIRQ